MKKILYVVLAIVFLASLQAKAFSAVSSVGKIGYVDVAKIFDEYKKTQDLDKILEDQGVKKQTQRDKMVDEIRKLKDEMELLGEKAREEKQDQLDALLKKLQNFDQDARDELRKERDKMARDILKEIDTVIQEIGKKEGFTVILNEKMLLYYEETNSLTNTVLTTLNQRYKGIR